MSQGQAPRVGGKRGSVSAMLLAISALGSGIVAATLVVTPATSDKRPAPAPHRQLADEAPETKLFPIPIDVRRTRNISATVSPLEPAGGVADGGVAGGCPTEVVTYSGVNFGGGQFVIQAGIVETEIAAAEFSVPPGDFPIVLNLAEMIFAQQNATQGTTTEWSLLVWEGNPETGTLIEVFSSDDVILPHISMPPGTQGVNVQVQVDPGDPEQIIINANPSNSFTVGYRIDKHNNPPTAACSCGLGNLPAVCCPPPTNSNAFPTTDPTGLTNPSKNWLYARDCPGATGFCGLAPNGWLQFGGLGMPNGDWNIRVTYTPASCNLEFGACCLAAGGCSVISNVQCDQNDGVFHANLTCAQVDCPFGACCFDGGGCAELTEAECGNLDGNYLGDDTTCNGNSCATEGACCVPATGQCASDVDEATCGAVGGIYQGNGSSCATTICFPEGACCLPDGTCAGPLSPEDCDAAGGVFHGDGSDCGSVVCPQPSGACCLSNGNCVNVTNANCNVFGGEWHGMGTDCADSNGSGQADVCEDPEPECPADLTGDGSVGVPDLLDLLGAWGQCAPDCPADLNDDGSVGVPDLLELLGAWGACG